MLQTPQEIEVWYVLPALRKELSLELSQQGLSQTQIAELLHITKPAVSQYLRNKRASSVTFDPNVKKMIRESAQNILKTKNWMGEVQKILKYIEKEKIICDIHQQHCKDLSDCQVCYI